MQVSPGILIIGYGQHVETKIVPAIQSLDIPLIGIVSSNKSVPKQIAHFKSIKEIINLLRPSHVFIATNPSKHLNLIKEATRVSKNLLVEKPITIQNPNFLQSKKFKTLNIIVKEAMMYKYNYLNSFLEKKRKILEGFKKIEVEFILPLESLKKKISFRHSPNFENSMLFDVGCYVFDFIWTFKLSSYKLFIHKKCNFDDGQAKFVFLKSDNNEVKTLMFKFGYGKKYNNIVKFTSKYDLTYELNPFFYGRSTQVNICIAKNNKKFKKVFSNENCFEKMIGEWYKNKNSVIQEQLSNFNRIAFIQNSLNQLSQDWRSNV